VARPVGANADATRKQILTVAARLFSERGVAGASIREIARQSGVSLGMVNHYYGSKEGLYGACIDHMYEELGQLKAELPEALKSMKSPDELLDKVVRAAFRFARKHGDAARLMQRTVVDQAELGAERRDTQVIPLLQVASAALAGPLGRKADGLRLPLQSAIFLVVRYAVTSLAEFAIIAGINGKDSEGKTEKALEDHLVKATIALLKHS
jgi:AcrR family transcriptional regulator